ncbi:MAG: hypothetical protein CMH38_05045 [Microbacterium sp.]|nr:hypothetical protein [Microbacterium sp.]
MTAAVEVAVATTATVATTTMHELRLREAQDASCRRVAPPRRVQPELGPYARRNGRRAAARQGAALFVTATVTVAVAVAVIVATTTMHELRLREARDASCRRVAPSPARPA